MNEPGSTDGSLAGATDATGATDAALAEASDPTTAPERLVALLRARRRDVRAAVLGNPNVPPAAIARAGAAHPEALAANPLLVWLGVEDPDHLRRLAPAARRRMLAVTDTGALWWATRFGDDDDRLAVLANASLPAEAVAWLADHGTPTVAATAAGHHALSSPRGPDGEDAPATPGTSPSDLGPAPTIDAPVLDQLFALGAAPAWLLPAAASSGEPWLRLRAAGHPDCPPSSLRALLLDDNAQVRAAARRHPGVPPEAARLADLMTTTGDIESVAVPTDPDTLTWLRSTETGQRWLAGRADLPAAIATAMAASEHWRERQAIAAGRALARQALAGQALDIGFGLPLAVDTDIDVRAALAANPHCPPLLVAVLAGDDEARVVAALAARPPAVSAAAELTPPLLDRVAAAGGRGPLTAARHPAATAAQLDRWADAADWRVRQACAGHAAVAADTLRRLATDHDYDVRHAVVSHPNFPVTEAESMAGDAHALVRAGVARRTASAALLAQFAAEHDAAVLTSVAANPATPSTIVTALAARPPDDLPVAVALALAGRAGALSRVLLDLAARRERELVTALARRPDLPDDAWARLLDPDPGLAPTVRAALHGSLEPTAFTFTTLLTSAPWVLDLLHESGRTLSVELLPVLAGHSDWHLRERAALDPASPADLLTRLVDDTDYDVRKAVAAHRSTPNGVVVRLAFDTNQAVRLAVAGRPDAPTALLGQLALDDADEVRLAALAHPGCPPGIADRHQALLDGRPVEPGELLDAAGGSAALRIAVARHPLALSDVLRLLAADSDWKVREAVAARPGLDTDTLALLAGDGDRDVRRAVAANPSTTTELLLALVADSDDTVRRHAIVHPSLPDDHRRGLLARLLVQASRSPTVASRAAAAWCAETPRYLRRRRRFWQSTDWLVRYAVATNPATEPDLLARLADDGHRVVRVAARERVEGNR